MMAKTPSADRHAAAAAAAVLGMGNAQGIVIKRYLGKQCLIGVTN